MENRWKKKTVRHPNIAMGAPYGEAIGRVVVARREGAALILPQAGYLLEPAHPLPLEPDQMNKRIRKKRVRHVLLAELAAAFAEPSDAIAWLETAHAELDGRTPREAIGDGEAERVTLVLDGLNRSTGTR